MKANLPFSLGSFSLFRFRLGFQTTFVRVYLPKCHLSPTCRRHVTVTWHFSTFSEKRPMSLLRRTWEPPFVGPCACREAQTTGITPTHKNNQRPRGLHHTDHGRQPPISRLIIATPHQHHRESLRDLRRCRPRRFRGHSSHHHRRGCTQVSGTCDEATIHIRMQG